MKENTIITATGLSKRYGEVLALDNVDLEVPAGSILGVLGPNGAGKTTAIRILTTLTSPDSGSASVAGSRRSHGGFRCQTTNWRDRSRRHTR